MLGERFASIFEEGKMINKAQKIEHQGPEINNLEVHSGC